MLFSRLPCRVGLRTAAYSAAAPASTVASATLAARLSDPSLLVEDDATAAARTDVRDPASDEVIATVLDSGADDTRRAIEAATLAGPAWRGLLAKERADILEAWHDLMHEHVDDLATIMTLECGKPLAESKGEVAYAASFLKWFAEECKRATGDIIPETITGRRLLTVKQPVGVCAMITPWNFPAAMITRKLGPALAAGCTAVVKPSEDTPLSALACLELARRAGVPRDVVRVVTGSKSSAAVIGTELATHPDVRKISFTGSTAVGKLIMAQSADTVKRTRRGGQGGGRRKEEEEEEGEDGASLHCVLVRDGSEESSHRSHADLPKISNYDELRPDDGAAPASLPQPRGLAGATP